MPKINDPTAAAGKILAGLRKPSGRGGQHDPAPTDGAGKPAPHVMLRAGAGTGKTTSAVCGIKARLGLDPGLTPSAQQRAFWDVLCEGPRPRTVRMTAFNKAIARELQDRLAGLPAGVEACTMHSLGNKAVSRAFGFCRATDWRTADLLGEVVGEDVRGLRKRDAVFVKGVSDLVGLCKLNLTGLDRLRAKDADPEAWADDLETLVSFYDLDLNGSAAKVYAAVPKVLLASLDVKGVIDFDDMVWLPAALGLPVPKADLMVIDEAQDLNAAQQALAVAAGDRLVFIGDPDQAIYAFAGADWRSMGTLKDRLSATERGCIELPLMETRRCGKAIVAEANRIVPDLRAHESNGDGKVSQALYSHDKDDKERPYETTYAPTVRDGDFILSRVNAPLVSQCFRFLKRGRKANIQGRDVAAGLVALVKKLAADSVPDLVARVTDWSHREVNKEEAKRHPSEAKVISITDKADCVLAFTSGAETVEDVLRKIDEVFTDDRVSPGIKLSSIHRAKGLEADRVFLLNCKQAPVPHPMAGKTEWGRNSERCLLYVGITRARSELIWVV